MFQSLADYIKKNLTFEERESIMGKIFKEILSMAGNIIYVYDVTERAPRLEGGQAVCVKGRPCPDRGVDRCLALPPDGSLAVGQGVEFKELPRCGMPLPTKEILGR